MLALDFADGVCPQHEEIWSTYGSWKVRNGGDENIAGWDFKPIKGD
jgi:hypothetical protein